MTTENFLLMESAIAGNLLPIVGAGVSMSLMSPSGVRVYPSWAEVLEKAAERLQAHGKIPQASAIRALAMTEEYQMAADYAKKNFVGSTWQDFLNDTFDVPIEKICKDSLELPKSLWGISKKLVTLNFDKVLRITCPTPTVIELDNTQRSQLSSFLDINDRRHFVWHLHGRIDNPESIIFTGESYKKLYSESSHFAAAITALSNILTTRRMLFVGCSLSDAELLQKISEMSKLFAENVGPHFALVHKSEEQLVRQKLLGLPFEVIAFSDFGSPLVELIKKLHPRPEKAEILEDTKKKTINDERKKIAVLVADPIDRRYAESGLLLEFKKLKGDVHYYPLDLESLRSLDEFEYVFIVSSVLKGSLIVEDSSFTSMRIGIDELLDNISIANLLGVFIFSDSLEFDPRALEKAKSCGMPVAIYGKVNQAQCNCVIFKLFKKKTLDLGPSNILINPGDFSLLTSNDQYREIRRLSPLSDALDPNNKRNFVGRGDDLRILCKRVLEAKERNEIVTLKGAGGMGKTALAKRAALELRARYRFSAGINFIDCEYIDSSTTLLQQFGVVFDLSESNNIRGSMKEHKTYEDRLVILDNAESLLLLDDVDEVKNSINFFSSYCTVFLTSRELLEFDNESIIELRAMTTDEAYQLFLSGLDNRTFSSAEEKFIRQEILEELLDNNPLAIKLVTRNVPKGKDMKYLAKELREDVFAKLKDEDVDIFTSKSDRNVERKRSIFASIQYSYANLNDKEKSAFEILSLFPSGINIENFKRISAMSPDKNKRKHSSQNNPATSLIVTDSLIKSLESKSLVEMDKSNVSLQSIVGRFAEHAFMKRSSAEIKKYRKNAYFYNSDFADFLTDIMSFESHMVGRSFWKYQKNFLKTFREIVKIDLDHEIISEYILNISRLCMHTCTYRTFLETLKTTNLPFEPNSFHESSIRVMELTHRYFDGDFADAFADLQNEYPLSSISDMSTVGEQNRSMATAVIGLYQMEGYVVEVLPLLPQYMRTHEGYPDILFSTGEFDHALIVNSPDDFSTFEAKLAIGILTTDEIDAYIKSLHKSQHLERMQANYVRVKMAGATKIPLDQFVVINPYTNGIKLLMSAIIEKNSEKSLQYFQSAFEYLEHIKYYYVEAHVLFSMRLKNGGSKERFKEIAGLALEMARQHSYRYLEYLAARILGDFENDYDSYFYSLSNEAEQGLALIKSQQKKYAFTKSDLIKSNRVANR